jgi:hypothetical protein
MPNGKFFRSLRVSSMVTDPARRSGNLLQLAAIRNIKSTAGVVSPPPESSGAYSGSLL